MTNGEKYKTAKERNLAFGQFCNGHKCDKGCPVYNHKDCGDVQCEFIWIAIEVEEEKPMPCPFCGSETRVVPFKHTLSQVVRCTSDCGYTSTRYATTEHAIAAHNRICKAVAAYKESEVK